MEIDVALAIGLSLAAALLLLLIVPIRVDLAVEREQSTRARARLSWLFGLVRVRLYPSESEPPVEPRSKRERQARRRRAGRIGRRVGNELLRPELLARFVELLRELARALRPRDWRLSARLGLDDPADTGILWGFLGPCGLLLPAGDLHLQPDFERPCCRFHAGGEVRVIPLQLLFILARFALSPPVLRALATK